PIIFLRGLDIRCQWSIVVPGIHDEDDRDECRNELILAAEELGRDDYARGREDVPLLFKGEPQLVRAWKDGQFRVAEMEEMEGCADCHNDRGDPCPIHG